MDVSLLLDPLQFLLALLYASITSGDRIYLAFVILATAMVLYGMADDVVVSRQKCSAYLHRRLLLWRDTQIVV